MPYYEGDYYQGDNYYEGDLKGFLGGIGRGIVGGVRGFVRGGPAGALRGAVTAVTRGGTKPLASPTIFRQPSVMMDRPSIAPRMLTSGGRQGPDVPATFGGAVPEPGFRGAVQRFLPGGQSGFAAAPPGYHVNKSYLKFLRAQEMGRPVQDPFSEPRAKNLIVRNRRLNPLNPRALKRSVGRQRGAVRLMRSVLAGTGYTISRRGLGGRGRRRVGRR